VPQSVIFSDSTVDRNGNNIRMDFDTHSVLRRSWIIAGPTASGKSDLAMALAAKLSGEIVAVDSMTLFRGMDIGTAKPTHADRELIPHHLIDVYDPSESSNVADWLEQCRNALAIILERGRIPILCGGTGLYWKALFFGIPDHPAGNASVRDKWYRVHETLGAQAVHQKLAEVDPLSALRISPNDTKRIIRALEVWEVTGNPISSNRPDWHASLDVKPERPVQWIWLKWPREILRDRIAKRVSRMFAQGWETEVSRLEERCAFGPQSEAAIGYRTIRQALKKGVAREKIINQVVIETRQFAKRQETWLRSLPAITPFSMNSDRGLKDLVESIVGF